jgi:hypothetical protein
MCFTIGIALILTRLWLLAAPLYLIAGLFFILTGLAILVRVGFPNRNRRSSVTDHIFLTE